MPSGGLYATYHLLGEPETTIDWGAEHPNAGSGVGAAFPTRRGVGGSKSSSECLKKTQVGEGEI